MNLHIYTLSSPCPPEADFALLSSSRRSPFCVLSLDTLQARPCCTLFSGAAALLSSSTVPSDWFDAQNLRVARSAVSIYALRSSHLFWPVSNPSFFPPCLSQHFRTIPDHTHQCAGLDGLTATAAKPVLYFGQSLHPSNSRLCRDVELI